MSRFAQYLTPEKEAELLYIADRLTAPGKGILAADESVHVCGIHFRDINVENTEENRRRYREVLFTADNRLSDSISGVILCDETARQADSNGMPFLILLQDKVILPGIKLDQGVVPLAGSFNECTTTGLDGLKERCEEYKSMGFQFAKWRCVFKITPYTPSYQAMVENANVLARYASVCQQSGLVPIVGPEILTDGDHDLETTKRVTEEVLAFQCKALADHHVFLEGSLLKPNMVTPGHSYQGPTLTNEQCALATVEAMHRSVPPAVAGIFFLSGGQDEENATLNLNAINNVAIRRPWPLTFSYGRALQASVLEAWHGKDRNRIPAQTELLKRAEADGQAALGKYNGGVEGLADAKSLFMKDHGY